MNHAFHAFLRRALVWLMLLAIPFQGVASAGMLACAHGATSPVAAAQHNAAPSSHCHEAEAPLAQHGDHPDQSQQDQGHTEQHDERCSACAACCIGAAMAGAAAIPVAPHTLSARLSAASTGRLEAVDLALPERPPRFPLA